MLKPFLQQHYWVRQGNIPALVILMQAYLLKAAAAIVEKDFVNPLLGIFQMVLSRPRHFEHATALLTSIVAYVPMQVRECLHAHFSHPPVRKLLQAVIIRPPGLHMLALSVIAVTECIGSYFNWLVSASKRHKHRQERCCRSWPHFYHRCSSCCSEFSLLAAATRQPLASCWCYHA